MGDARRDQQVTDTVSADLGVGLMWVEVNAGRGQCGWVNASGSTQAVGGAGDDRCRGQW